jgi:hypothetical protein
MKMFTIGLTKLKERENMKQLSIIMVFLLLALPAFGKDLPLLKVSDDKHYLHTDNGVPFFWLGGTAWEMIHRLDRPQVDYYLSDRAKKGFTVIQTVILAELNGLSIPNAYGHKPLINNDPTKLNDQYFKHVDYVVKKANELGLYVGLLPTWGDKFNKKWGTGPEIFTPQNAEIYGSILAKRYLSHKNIIWILGGDRIPENDKHFQIIRAMAKGIKKIDDLHLITYHPVGGNKATDYFNDEWLDCNMFQSGHSRISKEYQYVIDCKKIKPSRPVINGEARYENIPDRFWENKSYGWLDDADVRVSAYWSIISGAAGYTYGCNDIWQMYDKNREPTIKARTDWQSAVHLPGSMQMKYMREVFEILPWYKMVYDQALILNDNPENKSYIVSAIGKDKDFIVAYTPTGKAIKIDISKLRSEKFNAYWYNPRSSAAKFIGEYPASGSMEFKPWSQGRGSDFLLILVDFKSSHKISALND